MHRRLLLLLLYVVDSRYDENVNFRSAATEEAVFCLSFSNPMVSPPRQVDSDCAALFIYLFIVC